MTRLHLLCTILFLLTIYAITNAPAANAQANCRCEVQCTAPDGSSLDVSNRWPDRPDGRRFRAPFSSTEWGECRNYCVDFFRRENGRLTQSLAEAGAQNNICGPVQCTSEYRLGTRNGRDGPAQTNNIPCEEEDEAQGEGGSFSQYAAKLVCGTQEGSNEVERGHYSTTVNIHNPGSEDVLIRRKTSIARLANDGPISTFDYGVVGPHGAQYFDCSYVNQQSDTSDGNLTDGFFVIQSSEELDVSAVYTARELQSESIPNDSPSIDIEKIKRRAIEDPGFPQCEGNLSNSTANLQIDLSNPANWTVSQNNQPSVPAAIITTPPNAWDGSRTWMGINNFGTGANNTPFTYSLKLCSCGGGDSVGFDGNIKSDNATTGAQIVVPGGGINPITLTGAAGVNGNFGANQASRGFSMTIPSSAGEVELNITVANRASFTGLSVAGFISLPFGSLGACPISAQTPLP